MKNKKERFEKVVGWENKLDSGYIFLGILIFVLPLILLFGGFEVCDGKGESCRDASREATIVLLFFYCIWFLCKGIPRDMKRKVYWEKIK